ncbi:MAG: TolC family protein, partial [Alistipes sp.]
LAKNTVRRVESMQTKAEKDIAVLIESLYNKMLNYRNQIASIEASIAFAEEYLRAKNAAYIAGIGTATELVDAELNLAKVRIERMQAAYNFDLYLAKLLEAAGISEEFLNCSRSASARHITYSQR